MEPRKKKKEDFSLRGPFIQLHKHCLQFFYKSHSWTFFLQRQLLINHETKTDLIKLVRDGRSFSVKIN